MPRSTSHRDIILALLIAVWAHIGLFFIFVVLMAFDLIAAKAIPKEKKLEEKLDPIQIQVVYEDALPASVSIPVEPEKPPEPESEDTSGFVQTKEDQAAEKAPEETDLIGERDTAATSDEGAVAGDENRAALSGEKDRKNDPKTFDSDFSKGDRDGPVDGRTVSRGSGEGFDEVNEKMAAAKKVQPSPDESLLPEAEEKRPAPKKDELVSIDVALARLEEEIGDGEMKQPARPLAEKVEETMPEKPARREQEAGDQDGGFATRARKTRIAGVISARGKGSLNVTNTAIGRYQADLFKKLETAWQMENISNRSLLAPGNVTLYFVVNKNGKVSRQRQVSIVGASGTQWGMILRALNGINIPKMPTAAMKELEGDPLEIIVTFNY